MAPSVNQFSLLATCAGMPLPLPLCLNFPYPFHLVLIFSFGLLMYRWELSTFDGQGRVKLLSGEFFLWWKYSEGLKSLQTSLVSQVRLRNTCKYGYLVIKHLHPHFRDIYTCLYVYEITDTPFPSICVYSVHVYIYTWRNMHIT